jgi:CelD/BcsL family acetyltransferase involved in cellulose biosynthesis
MRDRADATVVDDEPCVVVDLRNWATAGKSPLPASLRADLRRRRRRAEELGSVRLEFVGEEDLAPALETLVGLHALRWHARGERGALDAGNVIAFHQEVADRFARRQWLRLCRLSIGERAAAVTYGFSVKRRAYFYIGGFDPAYARLGVGGLILHEIIRRAAAEGGQEFDFLRGEEDYKLRWGGQARAQYRATWPAAT